MLPCLVNFRSPLRHASQLGGLFPFSPYITSLLPYFLFPSSSDEKPVTATPLHSVLSPYCFKSFSCNTYWPPRKCCKQKTYGLAKPFRCNTYKNTGVGLSVMVNQESNKNHCPAATGNEDRPVPAMSGHESRIASHLPTGCPPPRRMLRFGVP